MRRAIAPRLVLVGPFLASAFAFASLLGAACSVDEAANSAKRCTVKADCDASEECYRGFCIPTACDEGITLACYTGDILFRGVGACVEGTITCVGGRFGACVGDVLPLPEEICGNGEDDDCDDEVDEFEATCTTGQLGVCAPGTRTVCNGACVQDVPAREEVCNMLDDDCDGTPDDDLGESCYPAATAGCVETSPGVFSCMGICTPGTRSCVGGAMGACEASVVPALSDGCTASGMVAADDDCDGEVDEDCECDLGMMQECYSGDMTTEGVGPCHSGQQTCAMTGTSTAPRFGDCEGERIAEPETCDNMSEDDDCNNIDDDIPLLNTECSDLANQGVCRDGFNVCVGSALECVTTSSSAESCNMLDDDCDGNADEEFDTDTDPLNCGRCGATCGVGTTCCGGTCTSTATDVDNCGVCGTGCAGNDRCCDGTCTNTSSTASDCGMCGRSCPVDQACCGGDCVDPRTDEAHCNGCGNTCSGTNNQCCNGACASPASSACQGCSPACSGAGEQCCTGTCVETTNNPNACGSCTNVCPAGQPNCCGSGCVASNEQHCGPSCAVCGANELCCNSQCVPNNAANCNFCGQTCGGGTTCCATGCRDLNTDAQNCGGCGMPCGGGRVCLQRMCCQPGDTICNGRCCGGLCLGVACVL